MKNSKLKIVQSVRPTSPSPWLDPNFNNDFRYEIQLAQEKSPQPGITPDPLFAWVVANSAEVLLYTGFAKFAPLLPTLGLENEVSLWTAPPPFGSGNAIYIVIGKDQKNKVRLVGGNYFTSPIAGESEATSSTVFFSRLDSLGNDSAKISLVTEVISNSISLSDKEWTGQLREQCSSFYTMPIYLLVLDGKESYFAAGPAVVEGVKQTNFSLECFGEVTL